MYKIDDEFRPPGRVFMKATREKLKNIIPVPVRKSSLKKGPAITTNLDDRNIQFQHEVTHEKSVEALIREYPSASTSGGSEIRKTLSSTSTPVGGGGGGSSSKEVIHYKTENGYDSTDIPDNVSSLQAITRNKRTSTEILGSSFESKKLSQSAPDGHRRITTHIVRKVTTLSRAEENAASQNLIKTAHNRTSEFGYMTTEAIEPRKVYT